MIAAELGAPYLTALAEQANGALRLAEGDAREALTALRQAEAIWESMGAPYETARTRALIGQASRALGDERGAAAGAGSCGRNFRRIGAAPDLAPGGAARSAGRRQERRHTGSARARSQILRLVAAGKTNRTIAEQLRISEKTVARHVSNIFVKLGLSSRSAATAYAYQHDLVHPPT